MQGDPLPPPRRARSGADGLPLYQRPGAVALCSDSPAIREAILRALPSHWQVDEFGDRDRLIARLKQEPAQADDDLRLHHTLVTRALAGEPVLSMVLGYWARRPSRYDLTRLCIIDESAGGCDPAAGLGELADWPGRRLLLAGAFDRWAHLFAASHGTVDRFVSKAVTGLGQRVARAAQALMDEGDERYSGAWAQLLSPQQLQLLRSAGADAALRRFARRTWVEWVVVGRPFGVLGLDGNGVPSWLQLELATRAAERAAAAQARGASARDVADIHTGQAVFNADFLEALNSTQSPQAVAALPLGPEGTLLGALQPLPGPVRGQVIGHTLWRLWHALQRQMDPPGLFD